MMNIIENTTDSHNFGLYQGKMGYCLSQFMRAKITGSKEDKKSAKKLLNEIGGQISQVEDYSFENGLMGIGWAIEWIAQQKYLKIDTNDVLEDLDDEIYKLILYSKTHHIGLANGTLGRTLYLYKRISTKSSAVDHYRQTSLIESLNLTIDELYDALIADEYSFLNRKMIELEEDEQEVLRQVLMMLLKLYPLKFNFIVNELLGGIANRMNEWIVDLQQVKPTTFNYSCLYSFLQAGVVLNNKMWVGHVKALLLSKKIDENQLLNNLKYSLKMNPIRHELTKLSHLTNDYSWQEGWLIR